MTARPKHPNPDLEKLLRKLEGAEWRVIMGGRYFKAYCPCGDHLKTVHLTPNRNYGKRLATYLENHTCWGGETR